MRALLLLLFIAACGRSTEFDGGMGGGAGGGSAAGGGAGGGDAGFCTDLPDDSPTYFPGCPGTAVCSVCGLQPGDGGTIVDGKYDVVSDILWESACGIIESDASHGTLAIANGTFELVSTGPVGLSMDTPTTRVSGGFSLDGGDMLITVGCGPGSDGVARYTSTNGVISLTAFPGLIGAPVFQKRP